MFMELKEKLVASFMAFENKGNVDLDSKIHGIRSAAIEHFEKSGFPNRKDEEWKYTSLNSLLNNDYSVFPKAETAIELKEVKEYFLHEISSTLPSYLYIIRYHFFVEFIRIYYKAFVNPFPDFT